MPLGQATISGLRLPPSAFASDFHWRNGVFYPPRCAARNWLAYYARHFDTVEVNTTFYRLPRETSVARWVAETPADFTFAVKVSRYVSLGSILAALSFPLAYVAIGLAMGWPVFGAQLPLLVFGVLMAAMIVIKHRTNIARLRAGTESKFAKRPADAPAA